LHVAALQGELLEKLLKENDSNRLVKCSHSLTPLDWICGYRGFNFEKHNKSVRLLIGYFGLQNDNAALALAHQIQVCDVFYFLH
jgi:hypothetical protein